MGYLCFMLILDQRHSIKLRTSAENKFTIHPIPSCYFISVQLDHNVKHCQRKEETKNLKTHNLNFPEGSINKLCCKTQSFFAENIKSATAERPCDW